MLKIGVKVCVKLVNVGEYAVYLLENGLDNRTGIVDRFMPRGLTRRACGPLYRVRFDNPIKHNIKAFGFVECLWMLADDLQTIG